MFKLIILSGLIYFFLKVRKVWKRLNIVVNQTGMDKPLNKIDDVMVKDPYCNVYFPKREGVHLRIDGADMYFCSNKCRDKYLIEKRNKF